MADDDMQSIRSALVAAIDEHPKFTATSLAREIGRDGTYLREFIRGKKDTIGAREIKALEEVLKRPLAVRPQSQAQESQSGYRPPPEILGARDFKVFASAECGPGEIQVFSTEPYELIPRPWVAERDLQAFGVLLTGDSMEPLYEAGQIAVVSPKAPLVKGKQALFLAEPFGGDFRASVKRYRGQTAEEWLVRQLNPEKDFALKRRDWGSAFRVLGAFDP